MQYCTVDQVKVRLGIASADTTQDAVIAQIILGVSDRFSGAEAAGRDLGIQTVRNYLFDLPYRSQHIWLPTAYPVVAITSIKEAMFGQFDSYPELVENTDFQLNRLSGKITRIGLQWFRGTGTVRITWQGGYTYASLWVSAGTYAVGVLCQYDGLVYTCASNVTGSATTPAADTTHWTLLTGQVPLPDEITDVAITQSVWDFNHRRTPGQTSTSVNSASTGDAGTTTLLPGVKETLADYRRILA